MLCKNSPSKAPLYAFASPADADDWDPIERSAPWVSDCPQGSPEGAKGPCLDKLGATLPPDPLKASKKAVRAGAYSNFEKRSKARFLHSAAEAVAVSHCGLGIIATNKNGVPGATLQKGVVKSGPRKGEPNASLRGVALCSSPWVCPVCSPRIAVSRAACMEPQAAKLAAAGWSAWLLTLTVRHTRKNTLAELFELFGQAWSGMTAGRSVSLMRERSGGFEYVRGYDATWSPRHGWNLHFHLVLFFGPEAGDGEKSAAWFLERWMKQVKRRGGSLLRRAQDMRPAGNAAAAAAYAMTIAGVGKHTDRRPEESEVVEGTAAPQRPASFKTMAEATAAAAKKGRAEGGLTSTELRERALEGDRQAAAAYLEFVLETKGKRAVLVSQGLSLKTEEEASQEEAEVSPELAGFLSAYGVKVLDQDARLGEALAATLAGGRAAGAAVLRQYLGAPSPSGLWQEDPETALPWCDLNQSAASRLTDARLEKQKAADARVEVFKRAKESALKTRKERNTQRSKKRKP